MKQERQTEQKKILLEYMKKNKNKHITIKEIQEGLRDEIGLTTIYRIMNSLIKKGVVTKMPFENKQGYCYKYNESTEECHNNNHYHLICEGCNKLVHFESDEIAKLQEETSKKEDFVINKDRIVFYGICKECKKFKK